MEATIDLRRHLALRGGTVRLAGARPKGGTRIGLEPVLAGRDASCGIVLADARVSSVHAELVATPAGVRVRDLGSRNGTWVQGVRIESAFLTNRAVVTLGETELVFEPDAPSEVLLDEADTCGAMYGASDGMRAVFERVRKAAPTDLTVLVQGETGTGKELVAQAIHELGKRRGRPFVIVDCSAIAPTLAETALFGHERGAFTGAIERRLSPFLEADGGTVFLDELGELPVEVQPKLLRALADRRVKSVGASAYRPFDVRVVAATRCDLVRAVNDGRFRSDLYFRVAQVRIDLPALRDRIEDVPGLVRRALADAGDEAAFARVPNGTLERLMRYDWPGNVRELRNAIEVAHALAATDEPIDVAAHVGLPVREPSPRDAAEPGAPARSYHDAKREALERFERTYFSALVEATGGNVSEIARRAGLERAHVRRYLVRHGLGKDKR